APSFSRKRNRGVPAPSRKIASDKLSQGSLRAWWGGGGGDAECGDDVLAARDGARLFAELGLERVDHRAELGLLRARVRDQPGGCRADDLAVPGEHRFELAPAIHLHREVSVV